jgi:hypothetical protein
MLGLPCTASATPARTRPCMGAPGVWTRHSAGSAAIWATRWKTKPTI